MQPILNIINIFFHIDEYLSLIIDKFADFSYLVMFLVIFFETYTSLRNEIKEISEELYNKPELVVLTIIDESDETHTKKTQEKFKDKGINAISCSIIDDESILLVRETIMNCIHKKYIRETV